VRQQERTAGQHALFGEDTPAASPPQALPDVSPWTEHERLAREKAVLGFFISGHPLAKYRTEVELFRESDDRDVGVWASRRSPLRWWSRP